MRAVTLPGGDQVPAIGQGTWRRGEDPRGKKAEAEALQVGIELGMTLIDTAEMYGDGATESFLGETLGGLRQQVFLVSKVYPQNAGRGRLERACDVSLKRLRTDWLDLYLLHWRGPIPLAETVEGMEALKAAGKIRAWGVSNLDIADMEELVRAGGEACATDQVLYNVTRRGPEFDLLPMLERSAIPIMAYSPVEQGNLPATGALQTVAERLGVTAYQVALAWVTRSPGVIAIPKASDIKHVRENRAAAELQLSPEDLNEINAAYPPPVRKTRLAML